MSSGFADDPHCQPNSECPKNFFGIREYEELHQIERVQVHRRVIELGMKPMKSSFDATHLRAIHQYLFQDVFPWAGEFRVVNLHKGGSTFGPAMFIGQALDEALRKLAGEKFLRGLSAGDFAERAAFYLGEINAIHPFREGNGRTQREFIGQLGGRAGYAISWAGFTQQASIKSHAGGDNEPLALILRRAIVGTE